MQYRILLAILITAALVMSCCNSGNKEKSSEFLEEPVYLDEEEISNVKISSDGKFISYVMGEDRRLKIRNLRNGEINTVRSNVLDHRWSRDSEVMILARAKENDLRLFHHKIKSAALDSISKWKAEIGRIEDLHGYSSTIIHMINKNKSTLVRVSQNLELSDNMEFEGAIESVVVNKSGRLALTLAGNSNRGSSVLVEEKETVFREISNCEAGEKVSILFFDFIQQDKIVAISNCGNERASVVRMNASNGAVSEVLFELPDADITDLKALPNQTELAYFKSNRSNEYEFLNENFAEVYSQLRSQYPEERVELLSWDDELKFFVFQTGNEMKQSNYKVVEKAKNEISSLDDSRLISSASQ